LTFGSSQLKPIQPKLVQPRTIQTDLTSINLIRFDPSWFDSTFN